jgi:hypothetical protein
MLRLHGYSSPGLPFPTQQRWLLSDQDRLSPYLIPSPYRRRLRQALL